MRLRRVARQVVQSCLDSPEDRRGGPGGRINAWSKVAGQYLRVVYVEEEEALVVISVIYPAKAPKAETQ